MYVGEGKRKESETCPVIVSKLIRMRLFPMQICGSPAVLETHCVDGGCEGPSLPIASRQVTKRKKRAEEHAESRRTTGNKTQQRKGQKRLLPRIGDVSVSL